MKERFINWYSHNTQLPYLITNTLLAPTFASIAYFQFPWRSLWWMSGLCSGLAAFELLAWIDEQVVYHTREINKLGAHYIDGQRYRLVKDEEIS